MHQLHQVIHKDLKRLFQSFASNLEEGR
jgi:hypothetical protein